VRHPARPEARRDLITEGPDRLAVSLADRTGEQFGTCRQPPGGVALVVGELAVRHGPERDELRGPGTDDQRCPTVRPADMRA
jgi:hypothetical protein